MNGYTHTIQNILNLRTYTKKKKKIDYRSRRLYYQYQKSKHAICIRYVYFMCITQCTRYISLFHIKMRNRYNTYKIYERYMPNKFDRFKHKKPKIYLYLTQFLLGLLYRLKINI